MVDIDELVKQYPEFRDLIQHTRAEIRKIDLQIAQIPLDRLQAKHTYTQRGFSTIASKINEERRNNFEQDKAKLIQAFDETVSEAIEQKKPWEQNRIKDDLHKILYSEKIHEFDKKDIHVSQEHALSKFGKSPEAEVSYDKSEHRKSKVKDNTRDFVRNAKDMDIDI